MSDRPTVRGGRRRSRLLTATVMVAAVAPVPLVLGVAPAAPAGAQLSVPTTSTPQLLENPSFEQSASYWTLTTGANGSGANGAVYAGSAAEDGHYLEINAGSQGVGAGVSQAVSTSPAAGHSYRASVMLRSPAKAPLQIGLVLWALGGPAPAQVETTGISLSSSTWTRYSVDLDVTNSGYTELVLQLYFATAGPNPDAEPNLDVDAAMLQDAGLANASFEEGAADWNFSGETQEAIYGTSADEDSDYLEWNSGGASTDASLYQDVESRLVSGNSYQGTMMLRAPAGAQIKAQLVLWAMGGPSAAEVGVTTIKLSSTTWKPFSVQLGVTHSGYTELQLQLYLNTPGRNLDVDAASLTNAGLPNSSFESGSAGWSPSPAPGPSGMNWAVYGGSSYEDSNYLEINTGAAASASVTDKASAKLTAGAAYNGYVELRSPSGKKATVNVRLLTTGRTPAQSAVTTVTVSSKKWNRYSVELSPTSAGYTGLKLRVGIVTMGVNLDLDAADVVVPHAVPAAPDPTCVSTPTDFANAFLNAIPEPDTSQNVEAIVGWEHAEGGNWYNTAEFNPLDTTQPFDGSTPIAGNPAGVQSYKDWDDGIQATVITITNGYYSAILAALAAGNNAYDVADAVGDSPWGTPNFSNLLGLNYDPPAPPWETSCSA